MAETANEEEVKRLRHYQVSSASGYSSVMSGLGRNVHLTHPSSVSGNEEDDGRVHTRDQRRRFHRLRNCGDVGGER